jgi:DNA-binding MarR family transcriptional regulator
MEKSDAKQFREKVRALERGLSLLNRKIISNYSMITVPQCHAIIEIGRKDDVMLKELSQILNLDTSTTSRMVDVLEKKNYVERKVYPDDRRISSISLTSEGKVLFLEMEEFIDNKYTTIFNFIPETEKSNVLHALDVMLSSVRFKMDPKE